MPCYVWKALPELAVEQPFHVSGEIVAVSLYGERPFTRSTTVLVRRPGDGAAGSERIDDPVFPDPEEEVPEDLQELAEEVYGDDPTCAGKDGECSRSVDDDGDYCWQHEDK